MMPLYVCMCAVFEWLWRRSTLASSALWRWRQEVQRKDEATDDEGVQERSAMRRQLVHQLMGTCKPPTPDITTSLQPKCVSVHGSLCACICVCLPVFGCVSLCVCVSICACVSLSRYVCLSVCCTYYAWKVNESKLEPRDHAACLTCPVRLDNR